MKSPSDDLRALYISAYEHDRRLFFFNLAVCAGAVAVACVFTSLVAAAVAGWCFRCVLATRRAEECPETERMRDLLDTFNDGL